MYEIENPLTRSEAIAAMQNGHKIRNEYFSEGEFVEWKNGTTLDEKGYNMGGLSGEFWSIRSEGDWEKNWEIVCQFKVGDNVNYTNSGSGKTENGIVKEVLSKNMYRVVYNCADDWGNYKDYTAALTDLRDLKKGWA